MRESTVDQKIKHLEMLARKTRATLSPARLRALRQRLEAEERKLPIWKHSKLRPIRRIGPRYGANQRKPAKPAAHA